MLFGELMAHKERELREQLCPISPDVWEGVTCIRQWLEGLSPHEKEQAKSLLLLTRDTRELSYLKEQVS